MNQKWSVMHSLLQQCPTLVPPLDLHISAPHWNASSKKLLYAPLGCTTQFPHAYQISHANALSPTNKNSTNHKISKTSTTTLTILIFQNYTTTLSNFSSSWRLRVKTASHYNHILRLPAYTDTLHNDSNLQLLLQISPAATTR